MIDFQEETFYKMHGAGNDFVLLDNRQSIFDPRDDEAIRQICHRHTGVGADGFMLISKSDRADFALQYFNADGFPGKMCGNGARCAVYFAHFLGVAPETCSFEIGKDIYQSRIIKTGYVELQMQPVQITHSPETLTEILRENHHSAICLDSGVAHLVILMKDHPQTINITEEGTHYRYHEMFQPVGVNVNFIYPESPNLLNVRVYEKGVEAETLACGTGAVASAIFAVQALNWQPPITVQSPGGQLEIDFDENLQKIYLRGPVSMVFSGNFTSTFRK